MHDKSGGVLQEFEYDDIYIYAQFMDFELCVYSIADKARAAGFSKFHREEEPTKKHIYRS